MIASSDDSTIEASRRAASSWLGFVLLRAPLRRDVAEDQHAARRHAALVLDRRGAVVDRALAAVAADQDGVVREADDDAFAQRALGRILDGSRVVLVDDPEHRASAWPTASLTPARQRLGDRVQIGDAAVDIRRDDGVADAAQSHAQQLPALASRARAVRSAPPKTMISVHVNSTGEADDVREHVEAELAPGSDEEMLAAM